MNTEKANKNNGNLPIFGVMARLLVYSAVTVIITIIFRTVGDTGWWFVADYLCAMSWAALICSPFYRWFLNVP